MSGLCELNSARSGSVNKERGMRTELEQEWGYLNENLRSISKMLQPIVLSLKSTKAASGPQKSRRKKTHEWRWLKHLKNRHGIWRFPWGFHGVSHMQKWIFHGGNPIFSSIFPLSSQMFSQNVPMSSHGSKNQGAVPEQSMAGACGRPWDWHPQVIVDGVYPLVN